MSKKKIPPEKASFNTQDKTISSEQANRKMVKRAIQTEGGED